MSAFFDGDAPYIAVTRNKQYTTPIVTRLTVLNTMLRKFVEKHWMPGNAVRGPGTSECMAYDNRRKHDN